MISRFVRNPRASRSLFALVLLALLVTTGPAVARELDYTANTDNPADTRDANGNGAGFGVVLSGDPWGGEQKPSKDSSSEDVVSVEPVRAPAAPWVPQPSPWAGLWSRLMSFLLFFRI